MCEIYVYRVAEFFCYVALLSFSTDPSTVEQFPCGELSLAIGRLNRFEVFRVLEPPSYRWDDVSEDYLLLAPILSDEPGFFFWFRNVGKDSRASFRNRLSRTLLPWRSRFPSDPWIDLLQYR